MMINRLDGYDYSQSKFHKQVQKDPSIETIVLFVWCIIFSHRCSTNFTVESIAIFLMDRFTVRIISG